MRVNKVVKYDERKLAIKPEGWLDTIIFSDGKNHGCGQAYSGIGINILGKAGGVLTNDDASELLSYLKNHFKYIADEPVWYPDDEA